MEEIAISTETIQLDQFLKWAGIADTGGQVKFFIEEGIVFLNGQPVTEKRKKLKAGDIIEITDIGTWKITQE